MTDAPTPDSLRPGSLVGPWRVEGYAGRGSYGAVYRARRAGHPGSVPVALKMALFADDPRFVREVEMLSRTHHPGVPQLLDRGWWHSGAGTVHPYLAMALIRGLSLYEWGREHKATSRQVLKVVAQVAWALEVVHRGEGLHRDVKGDNILVEPEGRAVLTDFGSCTWKGAPPITESLMPPGTREYRSPEALRFEWAHWRKQEARYEAPPADDLYALGVSAYRLVTRVYPPPGTDPEELKEHLRAPPAKRLPVQALNDRVVPELAALIERMLAEEPEERGPAREIAEAAESAAEHLGPAADVALLGSESPADQPVAVPVPGVAVPGSERPAVEVEAVPVRVQAGDLSHDWALRPGFAVATLVLVVGVGTWWMASEPGQERPESAQVDGPGAGVGPDAGTRGLGDGTPTTRVATQQAPFAPEPEAIALQLPDQPLPGQRRPPCRTPGHVEINGGCWRRFADLAPPCAEETYEWKGACYWPVRDRPPPRPRTSKPPR